MLSQLFASFMQLWGLSALWMLLTYILYLKTKKAAWVDIAWGTGIGLSSALFFFKSHSISFTGPTALFIATSLWSIKISTLLVYRLIKGQKDRRYESLDKKWGPRKYFWFFQFQAISIPFFLLPHLIVYNFWEADSWHSIAFISLFCLSWIGGAIADWQMARFREKPKRAKVCREGLWRYSRHPNYFFEILLWISYSLLALAMPYGLLGLLSPFFMAYCIVNITGIPPTEAILLESKKEAYQDYIASTNALIPWFNRSL